MNSEQILEEFDFQRFPLLKEKKSQLKIFSEIESPYGIHILFHQYFENIPVYNAGIKFNLDKNYEIINALNQLQTF
jgi:Zn-dependent metalloprotease